MAETSLPHPTRVHNIAKLAQTLYGSYAARFKGVPLVTLRLFSVYGPWEQGRRLIPRLMLAALKGRPMSLSSPDVSRDFIFVDDVVRAVEHCMQRPVAGDGAVFNLEPALSTQYREAAKLVEDIHGGPLPLAWGAVGRQPWTRRAGSPTPRGKRGTWALRRRRISAKVCGRPIGGLPRTPTAMRNMSNPDSFDARLDLGDEARALAVCDAALQWLMRYRDAHGGVFPGAHLQCADPSSPLVRGGG